MCTSMEDVLEQRLLNVFRCVCWSCHWFWLPRRKLLPRQLTNDSWFTAQFSCSCVLLLSDLLDLPGTSAQLVRQPPTFAKHRSRPSALMTVLAQSLATLHMLPRPATAIHLNSWCSHAGLCYIHAYEHTSTCIHAYIRTISYIHACMHAYIHTYHLFTHHLSLSHTIFHIQLCPTQLFLLLDPSPPPLSFLPPQSRYNICCSLLEEVDMWGYPVLYCFPYIGDNPNWLMSLRGVETTNQYIDSLIFIQCVLPSYLGYPLDMMIATCPLAVFLFFLRGMKPATQQTVPKKDVDMGLRWAPQIPNDFPRFYDQNCDKAHLSFWTHPKDRMFIDFLSWQRKQTSKKQPSRWEKTLQSQLAWRFCGRPRPRSMVGPCEVGPFLRAGPEISWLSVASRLHRCPISVFGNGWTFHSMTGWCLARLDADTKGHAWTFIQLDNWIWFIYWEILRDQSPNRTSQGISTPQVPTTTRLRCIQQKETTLDI